jgi:hypothetical protein
VDCIDLHIEVPTVPFQELSTSADDTLSTAMGEQVGRARAVQWHRSGVVAAPGTGPPRPPAALWHGPAVGSTLTEAKGLGSACAPSGHALCSTDAPQQVPHRARVSPGTSSGQIAPLSAWQRARVRGWRCNARYGVLARGTHTTRNPMWSPCGGWYTSR